MSSSIDELPWTDVRARLIERPALILPVGSLEQHGPHLPVGTNIVIAQRVAHDVSEATGILRAPTFSYGVTVGGGPFAGRAGLRRKTLHRAINELIHRWEDDGVQHFILITAHRFEPHLEALLMTAPSQAKTSVYDLYRIDVSDVVETDPEIEHAGELETSLMLHLAPELVRMSEARDFLPPSDELRKYTRRRVPTAPLESQGTIGVPSLATKEKGSSVFRRYVDTLAAELQHDEPTES